MEFSIAVTTQILLYKPEMVNAPEGLNNLRKIKIVRLIIRYQVNNLPAHSLVLN